MQIAQLTFYPPCVIIDQKKGSDTLTEQVAKLVKNLGITEQEALQVIADDKAIDKGEKLFELTKDQQKVVKKMTISTSAEKTTQKRTKTVKEDEEKNSIIEMLYNYLINQQMESVLVVNKSRQLSFALGDNCYDLTLTKKRKKKEG